MATRVDFDRFYDVTDPPGTRFVRGDVAESDRRHAGRLLRAERQPKRPVQITQGSTGVWADVVWTNESGIILLSARLCEALAAASITGWATYPVDVRRADGARADYLGLSITGRCGAIDLTRGTWVRRDDREGKYLMGLYFIERSWTGHDFLLAGATLFVFVTEAVKACLERMGAENFLATPLSVALLPELVVRTLDQENP